MAVTLSESVSITLSASEWLQIAGALMASPRIGVVNHLLDAIGRQVLKEP